MDAPSLEAFLVERVAATLGIPPDRIDRELPFASLGLDSAAAVELSGELERRLGHRVDPLLVFEFPTIARLAAHLAGPGEPHP